MPSTHFHCPHCKQYLKKSDPDYFAGASGGFVSFGNPERYCPACKESIDVMKIINGTYDPQPASGMGGTIVVIIIIIVIALWAISR